MDIEDLRSVTGGLADARDCPELFLWTDGLDDDGRWAGGYVFELRWVD
jgi:hypothetical protein